MNTKRAGIFSLAMVAIGTLTVIWLFTRPAGETQTLTLEQEADRICRQAMNDRLKAPATAKFPPESVDVITREVYDGSYRVTSYVDAENSFGALLRTEYSCRLKREAEQWVLIQIRTE